jgi:hypothetical protein
LSFRLLVSELARHARQNAKPAARVKVHIAPHFSFSFCLLHLMFPS